MWDIIRPIIRRITDAISSVSGAVDKVSGIADSVTDVAGAVGGFLGFATGGTVPGPIGAPRLAIVHGGEQVLTPQQQRNQQNHGRPPDRPMVAYLQIDGETLGRFVLDQTNNGIRRGELILMTSRYTGKMG